MIEFEGDLKNNVKKMIVRICDECGKKEMARMGVVLSARKKRKADIDLCRKCSCSRKYKPLSNWPKNELSHHWRGGRRFSQNGFRIHLGPKEWIYEHRLIMSRSIGRELLPEEQVHHINLDNTDNHIDNLFLCSMNEHSKIHHELERLAYGLLNKFIWFDRSSRKYTIQKVCVQSFKDVDISFLNDKKIHTFISRESPFIIRRRLYFNEPIGSGKYAKCYIHTKIAEKMIGRQLHRNEVVHHIDNDSLNNLPSNLIVMTCSEHMKCQRQIQKCAAELYKLGIIGFMNGTYYVK